MKELAAALLAVQKDAPALQKDALNPHFKSRYLSLESLMGQVLPVLNAHGIVLLQHPTVHEGQPALHTQLIHAESGEFVEDTMLLMMAKPDPQGQGSAITYARRYALMSALGLVADEDDDGATASQPRPQRATPTSNGDKATQPQHAKLAATLADLETLNPSTERENDWLKEVQSWLKAKGYPQSRAQLSRTQMSELIDHFEGVYEEQKSLAGTPFG